MSKHDEKSKPSLEKEKCPVCNSSVGSNPFTWLVREKPALVRFDSAICIAKYYNADTEIRLEVLNQLESWAIYNPSLNATKLMAKIEKLRQEA